MEKIFTFWEGKKPGYIELCMKTWDFPYIVLTYDNLHEYTNLPVEKIKGRFSLPVIADIVRVHVLRDNGGYWLDADTIIINKLPTENIAGYPSNRTHTIGFLHTEKNSDMYVKWAEYQDKIINSNNNSKLWSLMGNSFTDDYIKNHEEVKIYPIENCWPETYMIKVGNDRYSKYNELYFKKNYSLKDLNDTPMLMLHNSWTPSWYKNLSAEDVLKHNCTLSNILKQLLN